MRSLPEPSGGYLWQKGIFKLKLKRNGANSPCRFISTFFQDSPLKCQIRQLQLLK